MLADGQHQHVVLAQGFNRRVVGPGIGLIQREFRVKRFLTYRMRRRSHIRPLTRHGLGQRLSRLVFGRHAPVAQHAVFLGGQRTRQPDTQPGRQRQDARILEQYRRLHRHLIGVAAHVGLGSPAVSVGIVHYAEFKLQR